MLQCSYQKLADGHMALKNKDVSHGGHIVDDIVKKAHESSEMDCIADDFKEEHMEVSEDIVNEKELDRLIGARIKFRRSLLGFSQEKMGEYLGVSLQQVQKYEKGANRISASKLQKISEMLEVPVSSFFEDMRTNSAKECLETRYTICDSAPEVPFDYNNPKETADLLRAFYKISNPKMRRYFIEIIRAYDE